MLTYDHPTLRLPSQGVEQEHQQTEQYRLLLGFLNTRAISEDGVDVKIVDT